MLKRCLVKNKEGCFPIVECRPRSGSLVNAGCIYWEHQRRRLRLDVVSISSNDRCFQGYRLLKWLADKRNFIQRYASTSREQRNTPNMYDLYSASMNFSSPTSQYPGYYPYSSPGNELQSCMQQANKRVDFRSFDQYSMINNSSANTTINSRVPPLSHPPLPIVDSNYYAEQPFYYKNYIPSQQPQQQHNYQYGELNQYAVPTTTEYCDEDRRSEKSSDNDQGKVMLLLQSYQ